MNHIEHISVQGFRRLRDIDIELRPLNVMIGANGVGKTSFLEVLSLLSASASGLLQSKISELGGIFDLITRFRRSDTHFLEDLTIHTFFRFKNNLLLDYRLQIGNIGSVYEIWDEKLKSEHTSAKEATTYISSSPGEVSQYLCTFPLFEIQASDQAKPLSYLIFQKVQRYW